MESLYAGLPSPPAAPSEAGQGQGDGPENLPLIVK